MTCPRGRKVSLSQAQVNNRHNTMLKGYLAARVKYPNVLRAEFWDRADPAPDPTCALLLPYLLNSGKLDG